jgi:scaffold Nfu/NifU family protein
VAQYPLLILAIRVTSRCCSPVATRGLFVQTQPTPNPESLKFIPGEDVMGDGPGMEFSSFREAQRSPLAFSLMQLDGVERVFFGSHYIAVTKVWGFEALVVSLVCQSVRLTLIGVA